jgi:hypothetical protein
MSVYFKIQMVQQTVQMVQQTVQVCSAKCAGQCGGKMCKTLVIKDARNNLDVTLMLHVLQKSRRKLSFSETNSSIILLIFLKFALYVPYANT